MQRNQNDYGIQVKQGDMGGHDVAAKRSRSEVLRRDDHNVGIDFTGRGGVVSPLNTTLVNDIADTALPPRLAWSTGPPPVRPVPVLVKRKRKRRPKNVPRNSWSESTAALMTERRSACG